MVLIVAKNLRLAANTYQAVTQAYLFVQGKPTEVKNEEDVKFFLGKGGRFKVYDPKDELVINSVEEYESYLESQKAESKEEKPKEEPQEEPAEEEPKEEAVDDGEEKPKGEEEPVEEKEDVLPALEFVKEQAKRLRVKDFLKYVARFGVKARTEKSALKKYEKLLGGKK